MSDKPRTWTLLRMSDMTWRSSQHDDIGGPVSVIELEPVLDLLEAAYVTWEAADDLEHVMGEIVILLREHGRVEET